MKFPFSAPVGRFLFKPVPKFGQLELSRFSTDTFASIMCPLPHSGPKAASRRLSAVFASFLSLASCLLSPSSQK